jgi:hypothetical protein
LKWTDGQSYSAYGVRYGLRTNNPEALARAHPYLPLGWNKIETGEVDLLYSLQLSPPTELAGEREENLLFAGSELVVKGHDAREVLTAFQVRSQSDTIWHARDRLFVHAGVVGWQGQAILIPGRSLSGKTSLVKALVEAGASYYSDEFALLERGGWVHAYDLPLSIRTANGAAVKLPIEQLGGRRGSKPLPVGMIVVTRYESFSHWSPRSLSPARGLLALMDNTVAARREPEYTMPILRDAVLAALVFEGERGEARDTARAILDRVLACGWKSQLVRLGRTVPAP